MEDARRRVGLALALGIAAAIGWYGVYSKEYYSVQGFLEPWGGIAAEAEKAVHDGAFVISNKPAFFLSLTYALEVPPASPWRFLGSLPDDVQHPQVWGSGKWDSAGHPTRPYTLWIHGRSAENARAIDVAGQWLDQHCGDRVVRYLVRDTGTEWKQRLFPGDPGYSDPWRVEIRQYVCGAGVETPPADGSGVTPNAPNPNPGNPKTGNPPGIPKPASPKPGIPKSANPR